MATAFDPGRFLEAQARDHAIALAEVSAGAKRSHWMWYVFPQIAGLGHSPTARHYALPSRDAARAYLAHPILGPRYGEMLDALAGIDDPDAVAVFGPVDAMKLRSSLTLFAAAGSAEAATALDRWFDTPDGETLARI